jgi:hypothetical protein
MHDSGVKASREGEGVSAISTRHSGARARDKIDFNFALGERARNPFLLTFVRRDGFRVQPCGPPRNDGRRGGAVPLGRTEAMEAAK